jgi:hypothetical protein
MSKFKRTVKSAAPLELDAGTYPAVCVAVIDLGTQLEEYEGERRRTRKILLCYELTGEPYPGHEEHGVIVAKEFSWKTNEKANLRLWIESRRGSKFRDGDELDPGEELEQPCSITLTKDGKYTQVNGIGPLMKGMPIAKPGVVPYTFHVSDYDPANPPQIPYWVPRSYGHEALDMILLSDECLRSHRPTPF